jgi:hypothetical protein
MLTAREAQELPTSELTLGIAIASALVGVLRGEMERRGMSLEEIDAATNRKIEQNEESLTNFIDRLKRKQQG